MKRTCSRILLLTLLAVSLLCLGGCVGNNGGDPPPPPVDPGEDNTNEPEPQLPDEDEPTDPADPQAPAVSERPASQDFTITLEGMEETVTWTLYTKPGLYSIYYNAETLALEDSAGDPSFTAKQERLPAVWLSIRQEADPNATAASVAEQEPVDPDVLESVQSTTSLGGYPAIRLHTIWGGEPNSMISDDYLLDLPQGGCLRLTLCYFLEAAEGWGARLNAMANTIELL